ncbi:thymidylate synthase [Beggiatoa leptomitoformis]|uniref:Thymidylate synthase n=1 Tax=Beggiatoa leptomitoformis TaxID=288004 RepID=A0A2N9YFN9_9GAMM|nr:thymidylate synthase [Beggiatoa leptomitoformis]ALG68390.1 thymidylate synthase [Beggiatoa leptomitoformis]AUI69283.1 thymidylate synthase [Beggiatoa leptomitoformis]
MHTYLALLQDILDHGVTKTDRTGTGTRSVFGRQLRFDLTQGFPLVTTKKLHLRSIVYELLWFLRGDTNVRYLQENEVHIWDAWAKPDGDLGLIYGKQWVNFGGINQIEQLVAGIRQNPDSRRHIVSAWNPPELALMALPPCHLLFQCYVAEGKLSLLLYMRSSDTFIGLPFNIASYALLAEMIAQQCDLVAAELVVTLGDAHIYLNHLAQVQMQLERKPYALPTLQIAQKPASIFEYAFEDFEILNYQAHPHIKAPVAV